MSDDVYDLYEQATHETVWPFQSLYANKELFGQIIKHFPYMKLTIGPSTEERQRSPALFAGCVAF